VVPFGAPDTIMSGRTGKAEVVGDDVSWTYRNSFRVGDIKLLELDLIRPNFPQKIFEHPDGELLAGTAAVAEAERCEPGLLAYGKRLAINGRRSQTRCWLGRRFGHP
jgi:hypothetical protein